MGVNNNHKDHHRKKAGGSGGEKIKMGEKVRAVHGHKQGIWGPLEKLARQESSCRASRRNAELLTP